MTYWKMRKASSTLPAGVNETKVVLGVGIGGREREFGLEFAGGFGPVFPAQICESGEVVRFQERRIGLRGAVEDVDSAAVVADLGPELADEKEDIVRTVDGSRIG